MTQVKFELYEQSLENVFSWLENKDVVKGNFVYRNDVDAGFIQTMKQTLDSNLTPVVISNSLEILKDVYPLFSDDDAQIGVIHVSGFTCLNRYDKNKHLEILNTIKEDYSNVNILHISMLDSNLNTSSLVDETEKGISIDTMVNFIQRHDQCMISFDLSSLSEHIGQREKAKLECDIRRCLSVCIHSHKLRNVILVGDSDRSLYSRKTKIIYDGLKDYQSSVLNGA